jgi:hypothetical protein
MGALTDFFIATPEDVNDLRRGQPLRDLFPTLEMKNVDSSKLEILAQLVVGNWQDLTQEERQPSPLVLVKGALGEEFRFPDEFHQGDRMDFDFWIQRFHPVFVEALATFPAEQALPVATQWARQWAAFDGRPLGEDDTASLSALLQQLCQLATRARAEGKQLYLQTSL